MTDDPVLLINKADVVALERKTSGWICERNDNGGVVIEGGSYDERVKTVGAFRAACNTDIVYTARCSSLINGL